MSGPLLVALCGRPGSGKTEIQRFLASEFNIEPFDDGDILRRYVSDLLGFPYEWTLTQEGKAREIEVCGQTQTVRWALGECGNVLEQLFGELVVPNWAIRAARAEYAGYGEGTTAWTEMRRPNGFSFGSVRKTQGWAYKKAGGLVVEVVRPGQAETGYGFDLYDRTAIDFTFTNDGEGLDLLKQAVRDQFGPHLANRGIALAA